MQDDSKKDFINLLIVIICLYFSSPSTAITPQDITEEPLKIVGDNNYPPYEFVEMIMGTSGI